MNLSIFFGAHRRGADQLLRALDVNVLELKLDCVDALAPRRAVEVRVDVLAQHLYI